MRNACFSGIRSFLSLLLALMMVLSAAPLTAVLAEEGEAETRPVTMEELNDLAERVLALAAEGTLLNDPTQEEAVSEDGIAYQYEFGVLYGDRTAWTEETRLTALQLMDAEVESVRGITIDWIVNRIMEVIPCANEEMNGSPEAAVLYLEGDPESGFLYGRTERDGQRISAMEYGAADPKLGRKVSVIFHISGDGVDAIRLEGLNEDFSAEEAKDLYAELEELTQHYEYVRVPRSLDGTELAMFQEGDLWFTSLSYLTAEPQDMGDNVEDVMIENDDGTWLRRVDGDGFSAVFVCDDEGRNPILVSYTILSPDLEGPRGVRIGDLFHEDFTRFRSGEGEMSEDGTSEVLYGTVGQAPWGLAEYGDISGMTLRYVTPALGREDVELILRYQDTVLTEIVLHTLEEDEEHAD